MNDLDLKSEIFDLFENARELFNNYYNGKDNYSKEDIERIDEIITTIKARNIHNIKELIEDYYLLEEED